MVEYTLKRWNADPEFSGWQYITVSGYHEIVAPVVESVLVPAGWSVYLVRKPISG